MFQFIFVIVLLYIAIITRGQHEYKIDYRVQYSPGYICNYQPTFQWEWKFKLYTCTPKSWCWNDRYHSPRLPGLKFDNCNQTFLPFTDNDGTIVNDFVCCHHEDNQKNVSPGGSRSKDALLEEKDRHQTHKFMPGLRSGLKCNDYSRYVCLNEETCPTLQKRLVKGGTETIIDKYPHLAAVGYIHEINKQEFWFCLGSIISHKFILSAASCFSDEYDHPPNTVRVGMTVLCKTGEEGCIPSKNAQEILIETAIRHPKNSLAWYYHDLMLFKLSTYIKFNSQVRPACLYSTMGTPVGWDTGMFTAYEERTNKNNGKTENTTHEMELELFSKESCGSYYLSDTRLVDSRIDWDIMYCAGNLRSKPIMPCKYDYGGPLQFQTEGLYCTWQIMGVMVWSQHFVGCQGLPPPIFTRVSYYLPWIEEVVWPNFDMFSELDTALNDCKTRWFESKDNRTEGRCKGPQSCKSVSGNTNEVC